MRRRQRAKLPKKLTERCTVIFLAQQRLERMLVGSEHGEAVDPQERSKTQGLQAAQQGCSR